MQDIVGKSVIYVDPKGQKHSALVTADWRGGNEFGAINVMFVNMDEGQSDSFGQKIARATSVVHKSQQTAPGNYWFHVNEA